MDFFDQCFIPRSCTRLEEMQRTAEMMIEITERNKEDARRAVADSLHLLRSTNRTTAQDLKDLQNILDANLIA
jgi:ribosomal protein L17